MRLIPAGVIAECGIGGAAPVLVGLSGGADSVALLDALKELERAGEIGSVYAAHLHHGLRGASAEGDLEFCRALCQTMDVPFCFERADVRGYAAQNGLSLEQAARDMRYAFLNRAADGCGASAVAVAHHMDDQAETVLMHWIRGSGMTGLCGMRLRNGRIVRPLLGVRRAQIEAYLSERGLGYRTDETNFTDDAARNRIRHSVVPALETVNAGSVRHIAEAAIRLQADEAYLQSLADALMAKAAVRDGYDRSLLRAAPGPVLARALMRIAASERADVLASDIKRMEALLSARTGCCIELSGGIAAWVDDRTLHTGRPRPAQPFETPFQADGVTETPRGTFRAERVKRYIRPESADEAYVDGSLLPGNVVVRTRRDGDRFYPLGAPGSRKLSDCLTDRKIPRMMRDIPLLASGSEVLFVPGYTISERIRIGADTADILHIVFTEGD